MSAAPDAFSARGTLDLPAGPTAYYRLGALEEAGLGEMARLPYSIRILLEAALRNVDGLAITEEHVRTIAQWGPQTAGKAEIPFKPARVLMQDFTGVPAVVDLAALRSAMARAGGDPARINPQVPVDLVIDHSVQVDAFGSPEALAENGRIEFERNAERYAFLKWGAQAFENFRVVPPNTGIVHQVNLEYLAPLLQIGEHRGERAAWADSLVGTDSHTTMINGLGVLGWGVGGIEAEAAMLGQPIFMLLPEVVGMKLTGKLPTGATATDLVLSVVQRLREVGVVGRFVEFFGQGLDHLTLADRATIANMAPEYGATMGYFPVDEETLAYLRATGRDETLVESTRQWFEAQGLFRSARTPAPEYTRVVELDLGEVVPCLAGPKRPQDRIPLDQAKASFGATYGQGGEDATTTQVAESVKVNGRTSVLASGAVVIAAITSCTNTSNPSVMLGAGLLAKKANERGLEVPSYVKTSLAPGSRVVTRYLQSSGLLPELERLGFHVVGYGCTTCIGNSGPLPEAVTKAIRDRELFVCSVLSGNRNFEGRVNPLTKANYLASPPLVVAYALAGTMNLDLSREPLGRDRQGEPVYLQEIWPSEQEIAEAIRSALKVEHFREEYAKVLDGDERWKAVPTSEGQLYGFDASSTYIRQPTFFEKVSPEAQPAIEGIADARALLMLGDSVTTDHISPAGALPAQGPAGRYLVESGVEPKDFNSFGSRRGNHEVMMRGTFANIRIRNQLAPGTEGGYTTHFPSGEVTSVYEAAMSYAKEGTPLVVLAGKEYGTGSSRDWAAKGTMLLGVRAVIAESFERIHRSNLVGMGVLPLQFRDGESAQSHGLKGDEHFSLPGVNDELKPGQDLEVVARNAEGGETRFTVRCRVDSPMEVRYLRDGGILHHVLRGFLAEG